MPISYGARIRGDSLSSRKSSGGTVAGCLTIAMAVAVSAFVSAHAQEPQSLPPITVDAPPPRLVLPSSGDSAAAQASTPTMIGGPKSGADNHGRERCVDMAIGNDHSFGCINERFKRKVDEVNPVLNTPPIDAKSSDLKVGTVNIPGVQQQYGRNFGHSVMPYRPTITYPPVTGRH